MTIESINKTDNCFPTSDVSHDSSTLNQKKTLPLVVNDLSVNYDRKLALKDITLTIPNNKLVAIVGPNGAGKSTLLKAILGIIPTTKGEINLFGHHLNRKTIAEKIAYMPQRASVDWDFPASVLDVVMMGLNRQIGWFKYPKKRHYDAAHTALDAVEMSDFIDRPIGQLSGGQQQRVFFARALAQDALLYMLDEPLAGVDIKTQKTILKLFRQLVEKGKTIIAVHHNIAEARQLFDHAIVLNRYLIASGPVNTTLNSDVLQSAYNYNPD